MAATPETTIDIQPEEEKNSWLKPSLFGGRFTRMQYFLHSLLCTLIITVIGVLIFYPRWCQYAASLESGYFDNVGFESSSFLYSGLLIFGFGALHVSFFYGLPIAIKRAHDIGHSGIPLIVLYFLTPIFVLLDHFVGGSVFMGLSRLLYAVNIIYGLVLLFADSERGMNRYGNSAKYPDAVEVAPTQIGGCYTGKQFLFSISVFILLSALLAVLPFSWYSYGLDSDIFGVVNLIFLIIECESMYIAVLLAIFMGLPAMVKRAHAIGHKGTVARGLFFSYVVILIVRTHVGGPVWATLYWMSIAALFLYCIYLLCSCPMKCRMLHVKANQLHAWCSAHKVVVSIVLIFCVVGFIFGTMQQSVTRLVAGWVEIELKGNLGYVKQQVASGADAKDLVTRHSYSLLSNALEQGDEEMVELWFANSNDEYKAFFVSQNVLQSAVWRGDVKGVKLLIERGALAATVDVRNMIQEARDRGIAIRTRIVNGERLFYFIGEVKYPLNDAVKHGKTEIANLLIENGADFDARDNELFRFAAAEGHLQIVKLCIEAVADGNEQANNLGKFLVEYVEKGQTEIVKLLIEAGADVNKADEDGETPLHKAVPRYKNTEIVKLLIQAGADVNEADEYGKTALDKAVPGYKNTEIVKLLIEAGADINKAVQDNPLLLHRAAENGNIEIVKLLIKAGSDVNKADYLGETPLYKAADNGYAEVVKLLIEAGADVNKAASYGKTPLRAAWRRSNREIVELLKQAGAKE